MEKRKKKVGAGNGDDGDTARYRGEGLGLWNYGSKICETLLPYTQDKIGAIR